MVVTLVRSVIHVTTADHQTQKPQTCSTAKRHGQLTKIRLLEPLASFLYSGETRKYMKTCLLHCKGAAGILGTMTCVGTLAHFATLSDDV